MSYAGFTVEGLPLKKPTKPNEKKVANSKQEAKTDNKVSPPQND